MMCHTRVILVQRHSVILVQRHSVWAQPWPPRSLRNCRIKKKVLEALHAIGTHQSGSAKVMTARKSVAAEVKLSQKAGPQKGGQIKAKGPPTKPVEPLIQCVHQHEDQAPGVEDQRHGKAARGLVEPIGES